VERRIATVTINRASYAVFDGIELFNYLNYITQQDAFFKE
jgi:hypothetical protein